MLRAIDSFLTGLAGRLSEPGDSEADGLRKATLVSIVLLVGAAGIVWGLVYWAVGAWQVTPIPFFYTALCWSALALFWRDRNFPRFRMIQSVAMLLTPFAVQWGLGGFAPSSAAMAWGMLSPMGALMYGGGRLAARLFVGFFALTVLSWIIDPHLAPIAPGLSPEVITAFYVLNLGAVALIAFVLLLYFFTQSERAQERSEKLLLNILPAPIASRLKAGEHPIADQIDDATVLFADIVGFTGLAAETPASDVVALLDGLFGEFDDVAERHGLEKIKTIGDAYMAVAGAPTGPGTDAADHARRAADAALDMMAATAAYARRTGTPLMLRAGLNTGPMIAGVIGRRKFTYDVWGASVNVASRMESTAPNGAIQLSAATAARLGDSHVLKPRGDVDCRGVGMVEAFLLKGRK